MTTATRPAPEAPRAYAFPAVERETLGNGLRVAVARLPRLPLVTVLCLVDAGAERDPRKAEGLAALTADALGEGTTRLDGAVLAERFELLGTGLDTESGWDSAMAHVTVTPAHVEAAMALLGAALTEPAFAVREVERLRAEQFAALLQRQVEPRALADEKFGEFLYVEGSRYAVPEDGDMASVRALDATQARGFHHAHYAPGTTTLIFVGDITAEHARTLAERSLGAWTSAARTRRELDDRTITGSRRVVVVNRSDAPQTELRIGHRGVPRRHPDYFPILVMNALLGGLFSSRINLNLRERNAFTYGARSGFDWRRGAGPFVVSTAVKTDVTDAATREILREISTIREGPVGREELSLATAYLEGVFPIRFETTLAVAEAIAIADMYALGDDYHARYRECVRAVTELDVQRAAVAHLHPDEVLVLAVGDASAIRGPLERLELGPLVVQDAAGSDASP